LKASNFIELLQGKVVAPSTRENLEQWVSNASANVFTKRSSKPTPKRYGDSCNQIQAEWAAQRIKGLSLKSSTQCSLQQ